MDKKHDWIIGLDFGNMYSFASIIKPNGDIEELNPEEMRYGIPSTYDIKQGVVSIGTDPISHQTNLPNDDLHTLYKRRYTKGDAMIPFGTERVMLSEIIKSIIKYVLRVANTYLYKVSGACTNKIVLAHPESYSVATVCLYKKLIEEIELDLNDNTHRKVEVTGMISEPVAAALDYMYDPETVSKDDATVLVFDLGGGTFDTTTLEVSVKNIHEKGRGTFSTSIEHDGIGDLGGQDFTRRMQKLLLYKLREEDPDAEVYPQQFTLEAELTKRSLTNSETAFCNQLSGPTGFYDPLCVSRQEFYDICRGVGTYGQKYVEETGDTRDLIGEICALTRRVFTDTQNRGKKVDRIVCVGGASQMPIVIDELRKTFAAEFENNPAFITFHQAMKAISRGAARYAVLEDKTVQTLRRTLGQWTGDKGMVTLAPAGKELPCEAETTFYTGTSGLDYADCTLYEAIGLNPRNTREDYKEVMRFAYKFKRAVGVDTPFTLRLNIDESGMATMTIKSDEGEDQMKCEPLL